MHLPYRIHLGGCLERPVEIILEGPVPPTELELHEAKSIKIGPLIHGIHGIGALGFPMWMLSINSMFGILFSLTFYDGYWSVMMSRKNLNPIQFWCSNSGLWVSHFATEFPIFFLPKTAMFTARFILQQDPIIPCAPIADPRCQAMELEFWRNWDEKNCVFSGDELMKRYHAKCNGK